MTPPLLAPRRRPVATLGWLASGSVVALVLSGLTALAMAVAPPGESSGQAAPVPILLPPPAPAVGALSDPAPGAMAEAPDAIPAPEVDDRTPDLPELSDLPPDLPQTVAAPRAPAPDLVPMAGTLPPPPPKVLPPEPKVTKAPKKARPKPAQTKKAPAKQPAAQASAATAPSKQAPSAASAGAGKKAVASYGAAVMKKIRKTGKRKSPARGVAVVGFAVSASGGLASVRIVRSSGSAALDGVALDHIRRSAPFPPPPAGAGRTFSFEFVGR